MFFVLILFFVVYFRRNNVFGGVVDVLAPAIDQFSGYFLAELPKFEIVMMGSVLIVLFFFLILFCLVLIVYPRRNNVSGGVVDVLALAIGQFFGYFLAKLPKFEIVMMGLILVLSCFL